MQHHDITRWYDAKYVGKRWGHELWIANSALYCGKKLTINPLCSTSLHFHKIKREHIYVASGTLTLELEGEVFDLDAGDSVFVDRDTEHRLSNASHTDTLELYEFSTEHFNSDSYRIEENDEE
jgi:quercetin dioxygenase-like cupin family protein